VSSDLVVIVGLGEVGKPLAQILKKSYSCCEVDIAPVSISAPCSVLHVCYPFQMPDFAGTTAGYIEKYKPALTIINSTVAPGTTEAVYERSGRRPIAYSPVRGKHAHMERDMLRYKKFVGGSDAQTTAAAVKHFSGAGFQTATFPSPRVAELAKLLETTYFGILIGWAQEVERIAQQHGAEFKDVNAFIEEIDFLPSHIFPGVIGGHCVMPNIRILQQNLSSAFLQAVVDSNQRKEEQSKKTEQGTKLCSTSA
jgi:UDP-N-acetyl-D-mannosaminuronate dehydrogenase